MDEAKIARFKVAKVEMSVLAVSSNWDKKLAGWTLEKDTERGSRKAVGREKSHCDKCVSFWNSLLVKSES